MVGPSAQASPQWQAAHEGDAAMAPSKDRAASAGLKPQASTMPCAK